MLQDAAGQRQLEFSERVFVLVQNRCVSGGCSEIRVVDQDHVSGGELFVQLSAVRVDVSLLLQAVGLGNFVIVFFIIMFGFAQSYLMAFGTKSYNYRSLSATGDSPRVRGVVV